MANLNIAEKRKPQDGRCRVKLQGQDVDLRLSTFPTLFGEGVSIRLLSKSSILFGLDQLGLSNYDFQRLKTVLKKPNGIVLVTGPTGCGKTTTLYACVNYLNDSKINIVTLEDPIEYQLEGINQIQINPKVEVTFANGLRSILRQDPDVVMVGEIRDLETAQISIRAALTGHLIFSTLHTNDALSTITRLLDLRVEPYLVTSTLRAVVAQRLVRLICSNCRENYSPDKELLDAAGLRKDKLAGFKFARGKGCSVCNNTGYKGRMALFELLVLSEELSSLIVSGGLKRQADKLELRQKAKASGMKSLKEDGLEKVRQGLTTLDEVIRVTEEE